MKRKTIAGSIWRVSRQTFPLFILAICAILLWPRFQDVDLDVLQSYWRDITTAQWVLSGVFTVLSFWAVGQYDVIAHRQLDTGLPPEQARRSGMAAIALSQTLGFGVVTATLARWRMLRGFGPGLAALVTAFVSLTFMVMVLGITAAMCLILPSPSILIIPAILTPALVLVIIGLTVLISRIDLKGHRVDLPSLRAFAAAAGWALIDVVAAGLALWILIPEFARPDFLALLPVFCVALSAGLISGTPGGAGPFELAILAFTLPGLPAATPESALLVAVFGFRLIYFAIPAVLAMLRLLIRPAPMAVWRDPVPPALQQAPRAETAVIRQNDGLVEQLGNTFAGLWTTGQSVVAMFDPFDRPDAGFFSQLQARAKTRNRFAMIYKCGRQTAWAARQAGWQVLHSADDAVLDPASYVLTVPERASLRRKLRKADKAGVTYRRATHRDFLRLAEIDSAWQCHHGTARGGTMGRFCANYISTQPVFVAQRDGKTIAFASFQSAHREWALDVMRHDPDLPDGVMHGLVHFAIQAAKDCMIGQVSLAAVPACPAPASAVWRAITMRVVDLSGGAGLRQFKSSFAPRWKPLYLAAPSRLALGIGVLDIAREVFWPAELAERTDLYMNMLHDEDENYELASRAAA